MRRRCIHERISTAFADAAADGDFEAAEGWLRVLELASETPRCAAFADAGSPAVPAGGLRSDHFRP